MTQRIFQELGIDALPVSLEELTAEAVKAERDRIISLAKQMQLAIRTRVSSLDSDHDVDRFMQLLDPEPPTPKQIIKDILTGWDRYEYGAGSADEILQALASKGFKVVSE